jgi:hypothetical protein
MKGGGVRVKSSVPMQRAALRRPSTAAYGSTAQDIPSATSSRLPFTSRFHSLTIASVHRRQDGGSTTPMLKVGGSGRMGWMT